MDGTNLRLVGPTGATMVKTLGLVRLDECGLPIPRTIIGSWKCDPAKFLVACDWWETSTVLYVRLCISNESYPHYFDELIERRTLEGAIRRLLATAKSNGVDAGDLCIQPLLDMETSGASIVKSNVVLCEQVQGASKTLLRDGVFRLRSVWDSEGEETLRQQGHQATELRWTSGGWIERPTGDSHDAAKTAVECIRQSLPMKDPVTVLEWGVVADQMVFVDIKQLKVDSFCGPWWEWPTERFVICPGREQLSDALTLDQPRFEYIERASQAPCVHFASGAISAHACLRLAQLRIPTTIATIPQANRRPILT